MDKIITTPTGKIGIVNCERGPLEFVSLGDYGKNANIKADFLGLTDEIHGVIETEVMPLSEKWVITISTQYGCSMDCTFCDVPKVGPGVNASFDDMKRQIKKAFSLNHEVEATKRLNIHYARMGEPTFNPDVLALTYRLRNIIRPHVGRSLIHPVISTMLPKNNKRLMEFLNEWTIDIKNDYFRGDAGLQFSINSTSDKQRHRMFSGNSLSLSEISTIGKMLIDPKGRKYTLNFALSDEFELNAGKLRSLFNPNKFLVKITPIHNTTSCGDNNIITSDGYDDYYPYAQAEENLKYFGFDVIVFIPSKDEEESKITCGNAILSESKINK